MDPAANETVGARSSAPDDAMEVESKRWPHWPERGNGTARRDRLELRLFRDTECQAELAPEPTAGGYLVFVWTPGGYALREGEGEAPAAGNRLTLDGVEYAVAKLGPSPLPADSRRCAFFEPV